MFMARRETAPAVLRPALRPTAAPRVELVLICMVAALVCALLTRVWWFNDALCVRCVRVRVLRVRLCGGRGGGRQFLQGATSGGTL